MSDTQLTALKMIEDQDLSGVAWEQVVENQGLDPHDDADGEDFCAVMRSNWIYANLARLILEGDDAALAGFIEEADPLRIVRDKQEANKLKKGIPS